MNKTLLILSISSVLIISTTSSHAEIYKWVDAKGVTHYSAHPPVKKKVQVKPKNIEDEIKSAAGKYRPPKESQKTSMTTNTPQSKANNKAKSTGTDLSPPDKKLVEYCKSQRKNLEGLKNNFRNVWVDTNGIKTPLNQQQRQEKADQIAKTLKETCSEVK